MPHRFVVCLYPVCRFYWCCSLLASRVSSPGAGSCTFAGLFHRDHRVVVFRLGFTCSSVALRMLSARFAVYVMLGP
jgi:hypothetical protein